MHLARLGRGGADPAAESSPLLPGSADVRPRDAGPAGIAARALKSCRTRVSAIRFFGWLRGLGVTTLLVSEATHDPNLVRDEEFLADGVISLTMEKVGDLDVYRRIRCVKMRGVAHDTNVYTLEFDASGFRATQAI